MYSLKHSELTAMLGTDSTVAKPWWDLLPSEGAAKTGLKATWRHCFYRTPVNSFVPKSTEGEPSDKSLCTSVHLGRLWQDEIIVCRLHWEMLTMTITTSYPPTRYPQYSLRIFPEYVLNIAHSELKKFGYGCPLVWNWAAYILNVRNIDDMWSSVLDSFMSPGHTS